MQDYKFIGAAQGNCAGIIGCQEGPEVIRTSDQYIQDNWISTVTFSGPERKLDALEPHRDFCIELGNLIAEHCQNNKLCVIGGDHSIGIGCWQGYAKHYDDFGLVWFDAHMDLHTPETSPSKNIHGMPVATLLGYGSERLTKLFEKCPNVKPENVVMIGIRSYEEEEKELADRLGIKIFYSEECLEKGAYQVFREMEQYMAERVSVYGISLDVDGLDSDEFPATGTPEIDGCEFEDTVRAIENLDKSKIIGFDIVEYNPTLDQNDFSKNRVLRLIQAFRTIPQ